MFIYAVVRMEAMGARVLLDIMAALKYSVGFNSVILSL